MLSIPTPAELDALADSGWPAIEREPLGPWTLRFADGVTNRANSVLPTGHVDAVALPSAVDAAEQAYRRRGLPMVFQVSPATDQALPVELAARSYREHSATSILVADRATVATAMDARAPGSPPATAMDARPPGSPPAPAPDSTVVHGPSRPWMDLWWSVDGRGDDASRAVAERILTGVPALYASSGAPGRPAAVARLALVGEWGGLFAVATRPADRRRGHAAALIRALAAAAASHGVERLWLQVMADNTPALVLYRSLGFTPASSYAYWTEPAR